MGCVQEASMEEAGQQNTDSVSTTLSLNRGFVEERKGAGEQTTPDTAVGSGTDVGDNVSQSNGTVSTSVINARVYDGVLDKCRDVVKSKNTTPAKANASKVDLQKGRKLNHKNIGNLNCEISKKIANREEKLRYSSGKDETKEKEVRENVEAKVQWTKVEKEK